MNNYLNNIMKQRNLTLWELYLKLNKELSLSRLSGINIGREQINENDVNIIKKYLDLTEDEVNYLSNLKRDNMVFESHNKFLTLLNTVPDDLPFGEQTVRECPFCNNPMVISKASNGHISIICSKEGLLLIE